MQECIQCWQWLRAGVAGSVPRLGGTTITTSRIVRAVDHGDGTFTVCTLVGNVYRLEEPRYGAGGRDAAEMRRFATRPPQGNGKPP